MTRRRRIKILPTFDRLGTRPNPDHASIFNRSCEVGVLAEKAIACWISACRSHPCLTRQTPCAQVLKERKQLRVFRTSRIDVANHNCDMFVLFPLTWDDSIDTPILCNLDYVVAFGLVYVNDTSQLTARSTRQRQSDICCCTDICCVVRKQDGFVCLRDMKRCSISWRVDRYGFDA